MTASDTSTIPTFEPPGPGSWEQDPVHFPAPDDALLSRDPSAAFQERYQRFCPLLRAAHRRSPDELRERLRLQSSAAGAGGGDPPALCARRAGLCAEALARAASRLGRELQTGPPLPNTGSCRPSIRTPSPDAELVAYLTRCRDHHSAMIAQHMRFTAGAVLPTSDFLAHVGDWTGLPPSELLGLMRGSAEVSSGGSDEMERLKGAFARTLCPQDSRIRRRPCAGAREAALARRRSRRGCLRLS
jgi:hypothetical protein